MKKITIVSALLLTLGAATPAFAEGGVRAEFEAKKAEIQHQIKDNRDRLKEAASSTKIEIKDLKKEVKETRIDFHVDLAKRQLQVAAKIFDATLERFNTLVTRIESRITKEKAAGKDTSKAEGFLTTAKQDIADAKTQVTTLESIDVSTSTNSTTTARANFEKIKSGAKTVRNLLTKAKQDLQKSVEALKGLGDGKNASSTSAKIEE